MYNVTLDLYKFEELSNDAKQTAILFVRDEILLEEYDSEYHDSFKQYETSLTDKTVEELIIVNEYLFFKNGHLAWTLLNTVNNEYLFFTKKLEFEVKEVK